MIDSHSIAALLIATQLVVLIWCLRELLVYGCGWEDVDKRKLQTVVVGFINSCPSSCLDLMRKLKTENSLSTTDQEFLRKSIVFHARSFDFIERKLLYAAFYTNKKLDFGKIKAYMASRKFTSRLAKQTLSN